MNCPFYDKITYFSYSFSRNESHDILKFFKDISEEQIFDDHDELKSSDYSLWNIVHLWCKDDRSLWENIE